MKQITGKVCIIGAGTAGMAAAYALRHLGNNLIVVESQDKLGGTATQAWVNTWIEGINLPYFIDIFKTLKINGKATGELDDSWLPMKYAASKVSNNLTLDTSALSEKYEADLKDSNVQVLKGFEFSSAEFDEPSNTIVKSIQLRATNNDEEEGIEIFATFFIDSTGDGALCRFNGIEDVDFYYGEDPHERFNEELMQNKGSSKKNLNEPSLFFLIKDGVNDSELLDSVNTVKESTDIEHPTTGPEYISADGYVNRDGVVNPMTGFGLSGYKLITDGYANMYHNATQIRQFEFWKFIKLELNRQYKLNNKTDLTFRGYNTSKRNYGHIGEYAPMLGIRETYRIACRKMLTQCDLTKLIDPENLADFIACGSHTIDFHVPGNILSSAIKDFNNNEIKPSGISYGSIIPNRFKNVLIACRAYGASHIALAARRVTKDMAQLGWAAGHSIAICLEDSLMDTNLVDISKLQERIELKANVKEIISRYANSLDN